MTKTCSEPDGGRSAGWGVRKYRLRADEIRVLHDVKGGSVQVLAVIDKAESRALARCRCFVESPWSGKG